MVTTTGVLRSHQRRAERRAAMGKALPNCDLCVEANDRPSSRRRVSTAKFDVSVMAGPPLPASTLLVNYQVCGSHLVESMDLALPVDVAANVVVTKLR